MARIPFRIRQAWETRSDLMIFATADASGEPNVVYVKCVYPFGDDAFLIADNKFDKTRRNILEGHPCGSLLFICEDHAAYQIKGRLEYHLEGEAFQSMLAQTPDRFARHAAVLLRVESCFCGAERVE